MKLKENMFILTIILFSMLGLNSIFSSGRSPAVSPILEIPHNFPKNVSGNSLSGYDLSRSKIVTSLTQTNKYVIPVMKTMDLFILTLGIFGIFGSVGFFFLGRKEESSRLDNVEILFPKSSSETAQEPEKSYKKVG